MGSEPNFIKSPTPSPPSIWYYIIRFPLWIKNTVAKVINRITLLSLFILFFISLYEHNFDFFAFHSIFIETMKEVGIALFIVGSVSIFLEVTDYGRVVLKAVTDAMATDDFIDKLPTERLKKIRNKVEQKLIFGENPPDQSSFYHMIQNEVLNLVNECYYEVFINDIQCRIIDNKIYKTITRKIIIVNPNSKPKTKNIPLGSYFKKVPGEDDKNLYEVTSFRVIQDNMEYDLVDKVRLISKETTGKLKKRYDLDISGEYELTVNKRCTVELETKSIVPIADIHYHVSVSSPCKRYSSTFFLSSESGSYRLTAFGIGFMDEQKLSIAPFEDANAIKVEFSDWILPGDGSVFNIIKNGV